MCSQLYRTHLFYDLKEFFKCGIEEHVNASIITFVRFSDLIKGLIGCRFIITINSVPKSRLFVGIHF